MKSLVSVWWGLSLELGQWCDASTLRDFKTVTKRTEHEGMSFLTITLPQFGKVFDSCLDRGFVESGDFAGFSCISSGPLPKFLGGFLTQVFDPNTGLIRPDVSLDAVYAIRQLTYLFGKLKLDCTEERVVKAYQNYVQIEKEVRYAASRIEPNDFDRLARISLHLFGDVFAEIEKQLSASLLLPKHGPGKTADRRSSNERFQFIEWPERLEQSGFYYLDYALPSPSYYQECGNVSFLTPRCEQPVRVTHVSKTLKAPRIIAVEPSYMQYIQQSIAQELVPRLETQFLSASNRENLCYPMIGFSDQLPNREMARIGSITGSFATLDLSDASDRVSLWHVEALLAHFPLLREAVFACRTTTASVPGFRENVPLAKFASMGSALCFPIEAMVFLATVFVGVCQSESPSDLRREISAYRKSVRVYGDDIIVPTDKANIVIEALSRFGFRVNSHKSFWTGKFRESCGGDYYNGADVTPIRFRNVIPTSRLDGSEVASLVAFRNLIYKRGLWKTAYELDSTISRLFNGEYPYVEPTSGILGRQSFLGVETPLAFDRNLQVPVVRGYKLVSNPPEDILEDWPALLKFFLKRSDEPLPQDHLHRQGRPSAVRTKLTWRPPY